MRSAPQLCEVKKEDEIQVVEKRMKYNKNGISGPGLSPLPGGWLGGSVRGGRWEVGGGRNLNKSLFR